MLFKQIDFIFFYFIVMQCSSSILYRFRLSAVTDTRRLSNNTHVGWRNCFKKLGSQNGLPRFEQKDVAAQAPAGRQPCGKRQKHLHLHAGTGSQTSPERLVSTGTAVGNDWPAVLMGEFNCSERYCEGRKSPVSRRWENCKNWVKLWRKKGKFDDTSRQLI